MLLTRVNRLGRFPIPLMKRKYPTRERAEEIIRRAEEIHAKSRLEVSEAELRELVRGRIELGLDPAVPKAVVVRKRIDRIAVDLKTVWDFFSASGRNRLAERPHAARVRIFHERWKRAEQSFEDNLVAAQRFFFRREDVVSPHATRAATREMRWTPSIWKEVIKNIIKLPSLPGDPPDAPDR